jgi:chemotaxis response regulator CheB
MPRAVIEDGLADVVLPLGELAEAIATEAGA